MKLFLTKKKMWRLHDPENFVWLYYTPRVITLLHTAILFGQKQRTTSQDPKFLVKDKNIKETLECSSVNTHEIFNQGEI